MSGRLDKTLADYVAIAISPAMIMTLVGSLVFFLLAVFYRGHFEARLQFIMAMFVMAAVLIARISIEESSERATAFAMPLALLTALAIYRFVDGAVLISIGLLGLIWWCAHKLTWDCTLIDEEQDASGEGLLQIVGLDETHAAQTPEPEGLQPADEPPQPWWKQLGIADKRPHAPGVWIVYFSLAALPVFGIGQRFVPSGDVAARRYVFWLLLIYVASGLGLLLTTSFLGLRRYLRQRHVQMPVAMAGTWIISGLVLALVILAAAAILPRPASEYAISELPFGVGAVNRKASRYAIGDEGVEDREKSPRAGKPEQQSEPPTDVESSGGRSSGEKSSQESPENDQQDSITNDTSQQGGGNQSNGKAQGGGSEQKDASGGQESKQSGSGSDGQKQGQSQGRQSDSKSGKNDGQNDSSQPSQRDPAESPDEGESQEPQSESQSEDSEAGQSRSSRQPSPLTKILPQSLGGWLTTLFRWLLFAAIAVIGGLWLWRSWDQVVAGFRDLFADLRAFFERLFGSKAAGVTAEVEPEQQPIGPAFRPFSSFADPFATGLAERSSPEEVVRYSFDALEAWAREQGWPREPDATPHEFAQHVGTKATSLSRDARRLADLYCSVAYFEGRLPAASVEQVRRFWEQLESVRPTRSFNNA